MAVENNVSIKSNSNLNKTSNTAKPQQYKVNPNGVDKTPDKDTVQLSTAKTVGIGAGIIAAAVGLFFLFRGKKPPTNIVKQTEQAISHEPPKMQMTEEAKKIYDDVASKLHKKTATTSETVEHNLAPQTKKGEWTSADRKEYYTQLEKESDAAIAAEKAAKEAEAKAAREAEIKAAKEAEAKAAKEIKTFKENVSTMSQGELFDIRNEISNKDIHKLKVKAFGNGYRGENIHNYLSPEEYNEYRLAEEKLELVNSQIKSVEESLKDYLPTVCEGSQVPFHHQINGVNTNVRDAVKYENLPIPEGDKEFYEGSVATGKKMMEKIDAQFEKLPEAEKEYIVYRGRTENPIIESCNEDFKLLDNSQVGDVIVPDTAYSYTAFKRSLAENWGRSSDTRGLMYTIHIPKGAKVSRNMEHGGEVVMPRGAEYKILSKKVDKNGHMEVELEYILPKNKSNTSQPIKETLEHKPAIQIAESAEKAVKQTTVKGAGVSTKSSQKAPKITVNGNITTTEEALELVSRDGKKTQAKLIKEEVLNDGPFGKRKDYKYTIRDNDGKRIAECDGIIETRDGKKVLNGHGIQSFKRGLGLGTKLKEVIKQAAKENGCESINIDAAYASHMFHNKMGYKVNYVNNGFGNDVSGGKGVLRSIKTNSNLPEFEARINKVLASDNTKAEDVNNLLDEILSFANSKGLNSKDIAIQGISIPMTYKL